LPASVVSEARLLEVLEEAQARGFLGPGPLETHLAVARSGVELLAGVASAVDLGSGGGALGIPLAVWDPSVRWVLVESSTTRASFLRRAVGRSGLEARATVVARAAEEVGRDRAHRGAYDLVVSRSFGPPATTAECAAPLLRLGGRLAVAEPPEGVGVVRWPEAELATFGLEVRHQVGSFRVLDQVEPCPERFPRRVGVPRRRPLFVS
jgi:16S rRNA (guanine527-N7)-methyltransferase